MKHIYLIRHGRPAFPDKETYCLGKSDFPLSAEGVAQAAMLEKYIDRLGISSIWCSSLGRARQTAEIISGGRWPVLSDAGLDELYSGLWDGLPFSKIKQRWPELYEQRGLDKSLQPPEAEQPEDGAVRAIAALLRIADTSPGDAAVVTHRAVTRALIGRIMGISFCESAVLPVPNGSITSLSWDGASFSVDSVGVIPWDVPDDELMRLWHMRKETPDNVCAHEAAVAQKALEIGRALIASGCSIDLPLLRAAALVHDIVRLAPKHWEKAAGFLIEEGYTRLANIVAVHHGGLDLCPDEAAVLYYADKLIVGTDEVSVEERFEASLSKCTTPEAVAAHERRYREAVAVRNMLTEIMQRS